VTSLARSPMSSCDVADVCRLAAHSLQFGQAENNNTQIAYCRCVCISIIGNILVPKIIKIAQSFFELQSMMLTRTIEPGTKTRTRTFCKDKDQDNSGVTS